MEDPPLKDYAPHGDDDAQLAQMGHKSELKRQFSVLYVARCAISAAKTNLICPQVDVGACLCDFECRCRSR